MSRHHLIAIGLALVFTTLIAAQYLLTVDIRHDERIVRDLELIRDELHQQLQEDLSAEIRTVRERSGEAIDSGAAAELLADLPELEELDLDPSVSERAGANGYELDYLSLQQYELRIELCADFRTDTTDGSRYSDYGFRYHQAGYDCFQKSLHLY